MIFALCWGTGFVCSSIYYILIRKFFKFNLIESILFCFLVLLFEILSAKFMFILENLNTFKITYLTIRNGFSLMGVFFFLPLFLIIAAVIFKKKWFIIMNYCYSGGLLQLAFYRINCAISGCCGGIEINNFTVPTQILEILFDLLLFIFLLIFSLKKNTFNYLFTFTYIGYGLIRFSIEFFRKRNLLFSIFSLSHIFAFSLIIIGVTSRFLLKHYREKGN